jgi:hypothetical protein
MNENPETPLSEDPENKPDVQDEAVAKEKSTTKSAGAATKFSLKDAYRAQSSAILKKPTASEMESESSAPPTDPETAAPVQPEPAKPLRPAGAKLSRSSISKSTAKPRTSISKPIAAKKTKASLDSDQPSMMEVLVDGLAAAVSIAFFILTLQQYIA